MRLSRSFFKIAKRSSIHVLEEEQETISLNDKVWVKVKKAILRGRGIKIPYSIKEEDSEHL